MIISHKESTKQQSDTIAQALQRDLKQEVARLRMKLALLKSLNSNLSGIVKTLNNVVDNYFQAAKLMYQLNSQMAKLVGLKIDYSRTSYGSYSNILNYTLSEAL